jgi:chemotaxis family two-component system response regulator Rcp1
LIREVLARMGHAARIHSVMDGAQAIAFLRHQGKFSDMPAPDFVLLDLNLPCKDGRAVLAEVKTDPVLRKVPITIFSTSGAEQDILSSYQLGANCYVSKPGNLNDFIAVVSSLGEFWLGCARLPRKED